MAKNIQSDSEVKKLITQVDRMYGDWKSIKITTQEGNLRAGEYFKQIREKIKEIEDMRLSFTRPIDESKANIIAFFRVPLDRLTELKDRINSAMVEFKNEQDRKRREEEERLRKEAAEKERKEKERLRQEEEKAREEAEKARLAAEKAEKNGQHKKAQEKINEVELKKEEAKEIRQERKDLEVEVKAPKTPEPKVAGLGTRKNWKFKIIDANKIPRDCLIPDEKKLGEIARRDKENANVPGVEFYFEEGVV